MIAQIGRAACSYEPNAAPVLVNVSAVLSLRQDSRGSVDHSKE